MGLFYTVVSAAVPEAPIELQITEETNTTVSLHWKDMASNESGFYVMRKTPRNDVVVQTIVVPDVVETQIEGLSPNHAYEFYVKAYNTDGNSTDSNHETAMTTHTWSGMLQRCANIELGQADNTLLTRQMLESITLFSCKNRALSDISPVQDLKNVQDLNLSNNNISGSIPSWLGDLDRLEKLNLSINAFTGSIPLEILQPGLQVLILSDNNLTGAIPETIYTLTELRILSLSNNQLSGPISNAIGNLIHLELLNIGGNPIGGTIPGTIGNTNLKSLNIASAQLRGSLPASICSLENLEDIYLYHNHLTGTLPACLGNLTAMKNLFLFGNAFFGTIPASIGNMTALRQLSLYTNYFTGEIPTELQSTALLDNNTSLELSNNCNLYTNDSALIDFIDARQPGGYATIINVSGHCTAIPVLPALSELLLE